MSAGRSRNELVLRLQIKLERLEVQLGCGTRALVLLVTDELYRDRREWARREAMEAFRRSNRAWLEGMRMAGPAGRLPL